MSEDYGHRIDEREDPFETTVLAILDGAESGDEDTILTAHRIAAIPREALAGVSELAEQYAKAAAQLRRAVGSVRSLKLPSWLGRETEEAWEATRDLMDPLDLMEEIQKRRDLAHTRPSDGT